LKVNLADIVTALKKSDVMQGYVDIANGRVVLFGEDFSEDMADRDESEEERLEHVFSIEDQWQQYVALPNVYDEEKEIMRRFASDLEDADQRSVLLQVVQGSGAVARFERQLKKMLLTENWQLYMLEYLRNVARDWCEENAIEYEE
jgi:hypothetical protein